MTWLIGLSGFKGYAVPNVILDSFTYYLLRPQLSKTFTNEN